MDSHTTECLTAAGTPPLPSETVHGGYPQGSSKLSYSNKWCIEVSEGANSSGEIVFHVTPRGGNTQVIAVPIEDGNSGRMYFAGHLR
jgi:hypothetical protein